MKPTFYETVAFDWKTRLIVDIDKSRFSWTTDTPEGRAIDSRLRLITKYTDILQAGDLQTYKNYVATFAEITNDNPKCLPSQYSSCGFLPVGVEPEYYAGRINHNYIIPKLVELGLEYFLIVPLSPVSSSYKPIGKMASQHDVWVNKMEAAKVIRNKPLHNITTLDLLEVIL